jgi:hypothetical protein
MLTVLIVVSIPALVMAQGGLDRKVVISTNPILDMFEWFNGEVEIKASEAASIGVSGTYFTFKQEFGVEEAAVEVDDKYFSVYGFYRYYMQGEAFKGFYLSARLGYNQVKANARVGDEHDLFMQEEVEVVEATGDYFGFGIDLGYSWLLGKEERFAVSLGIGAIRLFGGDLDEDLYDINLTLPTIRLINVGVAF